MPELPEVEEAVQRLRRAIVGRHVTRVRLLHPSFLARLPARRANTLRGATVSHVVRRGKHQVIHFDDGRTLHAHFRMNGDWEIGRNDEPAPRFARALLELDDGGRVALIDSRALATLTLHAAGDAPELALGPEPADPTLDAASLGSSLATRRGAIKPALLDQRVIAGIGNIYAAEALWRARIDPFKAANALSEKERKALIQALRAVVERASGGRYRDSDSADAAPSTVSSLDVYDREGKPCRRCKTPIERAAQAGRSTYYCSKCQKVDR